MDGLEFYKHHRGGSGCVLLVISIGPDDREQHAIFGSIELARAYTARLGDEWHSVIAPYIVDDPDWGNEAA